LQAPPQPLSRREDGLLSSRSPLRLHACSEDSSVTEILRYAAFTNDPAGGNPAGVVLDAAGLDETTMRAIAAEVGYSETAFVTSQANDTFAVRYFSPESEVPFCGHATITI